jgi:hypothetical protein
MDETIGRDSLLDTPDKAILPKEFSGVSPSKPRERRSLSGVWEGNRKRY